MAQAIESVKRWREELKRKGEDDEDDEPDTDGDADQDEQQESGQTSRKKVGPGKKVEVGKGMYSAKRLAQTFADALAGTFIAAGSSQTKKSTKLELRGLLFVRFP